MVRGRALLELFPNHELARSVYEKAKARVGVDAYLLHQMGLYEMHRPDGNLHECANLLNQAALLAPHDLSIKHSMAEHRLRCADIARTPLEREKLLREASEISMSLRSARAGEVYGHHTLVKVGLKRLKDVLDGPEGSDTQSVIEEIIKEIERNLSDGLQQFPGSSYLLESQSRLAALLSDSKRVLESLQKAFISNPRNHFLAIRLAHFYSMQGDLNEARATLEKALEANRGERRLHYAFAKLLMEMGTASGDQLAYYLQRAFTPGDTNFDAQLRYARQLFINGDQASSKAVFQQLGRARVGSEFRDKLLYPLEQMFRGQVVRMEGSYCFIARDGLNDWIYAHRDNIEDDVWKTLVVGTRVSFRIAFTLRSPNAYQVGLETQS